jgi:SAM-dependent methyltransferase
MDLKRTTMTRDPLSGIRVLEHSVDYSDGAEDRLLDILSRATDLESLSDELAAEIDDWPTRYHLARERSNLLRPLSVDGRHRVLEIGAGTGAISRYLGETGARVVALEGSLPRAQAAAARCRDLGNVEVVCGALESFEDPDGFDLVCLIGVLEYTGVGEGGGDPESFLRSAAAHLRSNGTLVLAIENQTGLKYLIGYDEDHLGRPWAGIEGYLDDSGIRTYSRRRLKTLLGSAGLGFQRWLYPYPDYKMASVIVAQSAFNEKDAVGFIDQIVRNPVGGGDAAPMLLCDDRLAHRVMLEAGLGPEVANSFLILASAGPGDHPGDPDPHTIAWLYGDQRRRRWIRHQVVETIAGGRRIRARGPDDLPSQRSDAWLRQDPQNDQSFLIGETIWERATAACRERDAEALREVLNLWRRTIDRERSGAVVHPDTNPFLLATTREVLPPDYLDLCLSNFIATEEGVSFIDREWVADPAVDADLVSIRGLLLLAQGLVRGGGIHPWDPGLTVDELTIELGRLIDLPSSEHLDHLYEAETKLLQLVTGRAPESIRAGLEWTRSFSPTAPEAIRSLPISRLRDQLDAKQVELDAKRAELDSNRAEHGVELRERARLDAEVEHERQTVARLATELAATHDLLAEVGAKLENTAEDYQRVSEEMVILEAELAATHDLLAEVEAKLENTAEDYQRVSEEMVILGDRANRADGLEQRVAALAASIDEKDRVAADVAAERDSLKSRRDAVERKTSVRFWRRIQRLLGSRH